MTLKPGDLLPIAEMKAVTGQTIRLPHPTRLLHLQFRRFVDCPICNTHIAEFTMRAREIDAAGVEEVIVFHSSPASIRSYQKDLPFLMVGDREKTFYKAFGVEASLGFISLKALRAAARGVMNGHLGLRLGGGPFGLPADFLISPSGRMSAVKYGSDAYDQWSVDEVLTRALAA